MNKEYLNQLKEESLKSCDPNTKVACLIIKDDVIVSKGYNSLPKGIDISKYPIDCRNGDYLNTKYPYMIHAEAKAIVNARTDLTNATLYVSLFPCNECAKLIIEAGIKKIYYLDDKYALEDSTIASKRMLDDAKIDYERIV